MTTSFPSRDLPAVRARAGYALPRRVRRALIVLHVAVSVGWLGVSFGLLALAVTARFTDDPATVNVAYRAMSILAESIIVPVSLVSLVSGIVLATGRPWGLTRHYWIVVKLVLTLITTALSIFALRALIAGAVEALAAGAARPDDRTANDLTIAPTVATLTYTAIVAISVLKPWGRVTAFGRPSGPARERV